MEGHRGGALLRTVEERSARDGETSLAENFLLFGLLAEIFMRANGFNGGMGGSMHAFFPPFGAYPEQRHRRRLGRNRHRRRAAPRSSAAAAASRSPTSATARPAAARCGRR